jgi:hypothetical protein
MSALEPTQILKYAAMALQYLRTSAAETGVANSSGGRSRAD